MDTFVILLQKADIEVAAKLYANSKQCYCFDPIIWSLAQTKGLITSLVEQGTNYDPDLWEVTALESKSEAVSIDIKASRLIGELLSIPSKYCLRWLFWEMHYYLLQRITYEYYASCLEPPQNSIVFFYDQPSIYYLDSGVPSVVYTSINSNTQKIGVKGFKFENLLITEFDGLKAFLSQSKVNRILCLPGVPTYPQVGRAQVDALPNDLVLPSPMFDWGYRYIQRLRTFEWELSDPSLGNFFRDKISSDLGAKAVEHFCLGIQRLLEPYSFDRFQVNFFRDYLYAKVYYFTVLARTARFSEISSIVISDIEGGLSAVLATLAKYTGTNLTIASHSLEVNQNFASSDFSEIRAFPARGDSKRFAITKRCRDFAKHSAIAWAKLRDQHLAKSASHSTARLNILMVLNELWDHNYYPAERLELFRFLEFMAKISVESDSNLAIRLKPNPYGRYFVDNFYQNISAYIDETAVLTDLISAADLIIGVGEVSSVLGFPSASAKIVFAVGSKGLDYEPSDSAKLIHANDIIFYGYEEFKGLITQVLGTY